MLDLHVFQMDEGNYYVYPNNRIIWHDNAWVYNPITKNPGYEIDMNIYSVENRSEMITDNSYIGKAIT